MQNGTQGGTSWVNHSGWDYLISVSGRVGPAGISENIPSGFIYQSSNLPEDQVRRTTTGVLFSLPDGGDLTFTITGPKSAEGLLTGSYTDCLKGETIPLSPLFLSDGMITTREPDQSFISEPEQKKMESSGFSYGVTTIALLFMAVLFVTARRI